MAIYTVGRRRVIIALFLSAALLLTLDLRGNPVLDTIRDGFSRAMAPVETATDVVTNPVQRAWNSYSNYDDLERDNEILQERIDRQTGTEAAAEAAIIDSQALLALSDLPSLASIATEKAQVIGVASNNVDQIIEINKGSDKGIAVGMPVVNQAGLVGKITQVNATTSNVMLVTDPRYRVSVEILAGTGTPDTEADVTENTTPSGSTDDELDAIEQESIDSTSTTTAPPAVDDAAEGAEVDPTATNPLDVFGGEPELPGAVDPNDTVPGGTVPGETVSGETVPGETVPGEEAPPGSGPELDENGEPVDTSTTTTIAVVAEEFGVEKEFGSLEGRGEGLPSQVRFLQDTPSLAVLEVGDLVETAGGSKSLAPPNIPIGRVINVADRPGVGGPLLEIELNADLDRLNLVQVVLYRPLSEVAEQ